MTDNELTLIFRKKAEEKHIIQLENMNRIPVGAIYPNGRYSEKIVICQTEKAQEKYYVYIPSEIGHVAVFFTYWRAL